MVQFKFSKKFFNNVYWHLLKAFADTTLRYIWIYGGSSASKTYSVCQLIIVLMLTNKRENTLVLRKYGTDIKDSIYADFKGIIDKWSLNQYFKCQQNYIECTLTGSYIRFRGLDDSEKVKGISNFKRVVLEEISQFDEVDFKQIKKRLRGVEGQQIVGIFNPVSEDHWIKTNVFDKEELIEIDTIQEANQLSKNTEDWKLTGKWLNNLGNTLILKTNYTDNKFIVGPYFVDQHVINDFEKDKLDDYNYYQIYGLGNWGKIRTGGEFWKDFNSNSHSQVVKWDEEFPLHITWDENVNPFLTMLIWQGVGKHVKQIDEICLEDPRNRVADVCSEFVNRYPQDRVKGLFVYGDRTSIKEDTKLEKGENFFTKVLQHLRDYRPALRMQSVNPSVAQSAGFINQIYAGRIVGLEIKIGTNCKKSLRDYQYALEDSDGTLKKSKKTNPITKVSYEEYGHPSDAKRYFLINYFNQEYNEYLRGGRKSQISTGSGGSKNKY
jgi:phage terminase large subunit